MLIYVHMCSKCCSSSPLSMCGDIHYIFLELGWWGSTTLSGPRDRMKFNAWHPYPTNLRRRRDEDDLFTIPDTEDSFSGSSSIDLPQLVLVA